MSAAVLLVVSIFAFFGGYALYGRYVAGRMRLRPDRPTPAHTMTDGIDYVPAKPQILIGHHFSSIAGAAPIIGPITAAVFGWVPVYVWIVLGGVFMGAVHDFSALVASVRHQGRSIGEVINQRLGSGAKTLFLSFAWAALALVIAVFTNAVALTFNKVPEAATASSLLIGMAVFFGLAVYRLRVPLKVATIIGIALIAGTMVVGQHLPLKLTVTQWKLLLLGYIFIASVTPVWILLQPRDFLNSFLLYALMIAGVVGTLFANPTIQLPPFVGFVSDIGPLFPVLFVTVACGALSGFHSLVASGTTAKQLDNESHARPISMGAMLIESLLAVIALITVAMLTPAEHQQQMHQGAVPIFANGIGGFVTITGCSLAVGVTFASVAVAEFALTSLDTATRIGRFAFQELIQPAPDETSKTARMRDRVSRNRFLATAVTVAAGGALALSGTERSIWPVFGAANQMLAAMAFLAVLVWLLHSGQKALYILLPTLFMFIVTLGALLYMTVKFVRDGNWLLAVISLLLGLLALVLIGKAVKALRRARGAPTEAKAEPTVAPGDGGRPSGR
jgi:carbon starvation protein